MTDPNLQKHVQVRLTNEAWEALWIVRGKLGPGATLSDAVLELTKVRDKT